MKEKMIENRDYTVLRLGSLNEGKMLRLEHYVSSEGVDISTLITKGENVLETMIRESKDTENKAYEALLETAKQWEQQAAVTQVLNYTLDYLRTPEVTHTNNVWEKIASWNNSEQISNRVYKMTCSVLECSKYDRETDQKIPNAWLVSWNVKVRSANGFEENIAGQQNRRYTDKAAALKYLKGRKKAFAHLFKDISPQIPKKCEYIFTRHGMLLPGYTVESQEMDKTDSVIVTEKG